MEKQTENGLMDMGRGEERVRRMKRVTWKLTLPYVKQMTSASVMHEVGHKTDALGKPGEPWGGEGGS